MGKSTLVMDSYNQHYFSGSQCRVYFSGIYVADVNYIEFSLASNKAPIYSYNDPYYKMVAQGNYLVQGNFNLNLTERGKIVQVNRKLVRQRSRPGRNTTFQFTGARGADGILKYLEAANSDDKEAVLNTYAEVYWGVNLHPGPSRQTRMDEWDLMANGDIDPDGFDIVMVYGVPAGPSNEFTVRQINDVHITGNSVVNAADGNPIADQYSFFARTLDGKATLFYEPLVPDAAASEAMKKAEEVEQRQPIDLTKHVMTVSARSGLGNAGHWIGHFYFSTGNPAIRIQSVTATTYLAIPAETVGTKGVTLAAEPRKILNVGGSSDPGTAQQYSVEGIPWDHDYCELRGVTCKLTHDQYPGEVWVTDVMNFVSSNGIMEKIDEYSGVGSMEMIEQMKQQSGAPIRVLSPKVGTNMPAREN